MAENETSFERRARLFAELCDLDADARAAALARLHDESPELAADLERLLAADDESVGLIEELRGEVAGAVARELLSEADLEVAPPERLGAWRLGAKLGVGGMGEVWAAERVEGGFAQTAAIKLVRSAVASRSVVSRFNLERQLLARLVHPRIARLYDGGVAPDGRPWFAMERVDGTPLTRFAVERSLAVEERLRLFLKVAEAVDFAHRNLVVHRDLKPSNVLVEADGEPKLLDFGLAKILDPVLEAEGTAATRTELRALTPAYAAPEQILGETVTTATDVYTLGLILYELLAGELPHRRRSSSGPALIEEVAHESFERPSERLRRLLAGEAQANRRLAGDIRRLEGDLDTIVLKALAREPERRYASVAALSADVVAHLEERPIAARPDSIGYRLSKFVGRHQLGVAAALAVLISLVGGLLVSLRQTERANVAAAVARSEATRAERVKGFLVSVFDQADPTRTMGAEMPARQILAEGARRLESELADEPEVRAELFDVVARIQASLGLLDEGLASAERAAAERAELFGRDSREYATSLATVGSALLRKARIAEAGLRFEAAVAIHERLGGAETVEFAEALSGRAESRMMTGDAEGSLADERRSVEIYLRLRGPADPKTLEHQSNLAVIESERGKYEEAILIYREVLAKLEARDGADSAAVLAVALNLALALDFAGRTDESLVEFDRVIEGRRRIYGSRHPSVAEALHFASLRLSRVGRSEAALAALAEARAIYVPLDHPDIGSIDNYSGLVLSDLGRFAEAEEAHRRGLARLVKDHGDDQLVVIVARGNVATVIQDQGRSAEALPLLEEVVAQLRAAGEFDNPRLLRLRLSWGAALRSLGRFDEAREIFESARAVAAEKLEPGHLRFADCDVELARLDLVEGAPGSRERASERIADAERIAVAKPGNPPLERNLALARAELAARGGKP